MERSHREDQKRFYSCHSFYSLDDFAMQLAVHNEITGEVCGETPSSFITMTSVAAATKPIPPKQPTQRVRNRRLRHNGRRKRDARERRRHQMSLSPRAMRAVARLPLPPYPCLLYTSRCV